MSEVNSLILNVKSDSVLRGAKSLEKLESSAKKADKAADKLERGQRGLSDQNKRTSNTTNKLEKDVEDLTSDFGKAERSARKLDKGMSSGTKTMLKYAAAYVSINAAISAGKFLLTAAADMETLETSFISLTGSAEEAEKQVRILTNFTASTPFQIDGVATAARQLITAKGSTEGLTESLKVLGDISSAANIPIQELAAIYTKSFNKGKIQAEELNQISERGIPIIAQLAEQMGVTREEVFKLGSEGKIAFADLEEAFVAFGSEGGFAFEAMDLQSQTLNGQISTLKDTVGIAAASIGSDLAEAFGVSDIIEGLRVTAEWVGRIGETAQQASQREIDSANTINQILSRRAELKGEIAEAQIRFDITTKSAANKKWERELLILQIQDEKLQLKFAEIPLDERKIHFLKQELAASEKSKQSVIDQAKARNIAENLSRGIFGDIAESQITLNQNEEYRLQLIENGEKLLQHQLNTLENIVSEANKPIPVLDQGLVDNFESVEKSLRSQGEVIQDQFNARVQAIADYQGTLESVATLTAQQVDRIDQALSRAKAARDNAFLGLIPRDPDGKPRWQTSGGNSPPTKRASFKPSRRSFKPSRRSGGSSVRSSGPSEFDRLKESLQREDKLVEESYLKRLELIRNNTKAGSDIRAELEEKIKQQYEKDAETFTEKLVNETSIYAQSLDNQLGVLQNHYDKKRQLVLENEKLTETEKAALVEKLSNQQAATKKQIEEKRNAESLTVASETFNNLSAISEAFGKRGAKAAKAFAIAQTTIDTYTSATAAYKAMAGIPIIGPGLGVAAAGAAIAAGLANVSAIRSQNTNVGSYEQGGIIPGASFSGDNLTANVNSGEMVLNKMQQANLFNLANNPKSNNQATPVQNQTANNGNLNITVLPTAGTTADIKQDPNNPQNLEIILRKVDEKLTSDLQTGDGQFIPALTTKVPALRQA